MVRPSITLCNLFIIFYLGGRRKNKYDMKKERLSYDDESIYNYLVKSDIYIDCILDDEKGV